MSRKLHRWLVVPLATLLPGVALGESFQGTRTNDLSETSHRVEVTLFRDHADVVVTRTITNVGADADQALFRIDRPAGAAATRLRSRGAMDGLPVWFEGELMEASDALKKYRELTGIDMRNRRVGDPALLSWIDDARLELRVFPCPAHDEKVVSYTWTMPTAYANGTYMLDLPQMGLGDLPAEVSVHTADPQGTLTSDTAFLADGPHQVTFTLPQRDVLSGGLGSVAVGSDSLVRLRFDAAKEVGHVPRSARVIVLLDQSRSLNAEKEAAYRAMASSYLQSFADTDSKIAVVGFSHTTHARTKGFVSVSDALTALAEPADLKNGSDIDMALAASAKLLWAEDGPKRVVLFSDFVFAKRIDAAKVSAIFPAGTVLHLVNAYSGRAALARDDESPWAALPRTTGGLYWRASGGDGADDSQRSVFEELARPKRIDHVSVSASIPDAPSKLDEGSSFSYFDVLPGALPKEVTMKGELWSEPIVQTLVATAENDSRAAALAFGSDIYTRFDKDQQLTLATLGKAVSPVTSYLAIEPGVRPSIDGLASIGTGFGIGNGSGRLSGSHRYKPPVVRLGDDFDPDQWLRTRLLEMKDQCSVTHSLHVRVESTTVEIVDVNTTGDAPCPLQSREACTKSRQCMNDAIWELELSSEFSRYSTHELDETL